MSAHGHCIVDRFRQVSTGLDKSEQVWRAFFLNRELHAVVIWPIPQTCVQFSNHTSLETLQLSQGVETAFHHASIGVRCELVWSATFFSAAPDVRRSKALD